MKRLGLVFVTILLLFTICLPVSAEPAEYDTSLQTMQGGGQAPVEHAGLTDDRVMKGNWEGIPIVSNEERIHDFTWMLSPEEKIDLEAKAEYIRETYEIDVLYVITNNLEGRTTEEYGDDFFEANAFGLGSDTSGIYLLLDYENNVVHIGTHGKAIKMFSDSTIDLLLDDAFEVLSVDRYNAYGVGSRVFFSIDTFLEKKYAKIAADNAILRQFQKELPIYGTQGTPPKEHAGLTDERVTKGNWDHIPIVDNHYKVHDFSDALTAEEQKTLEKKARQLVEEYHIDVLVIITGDTQNRTAEEFGNDFFVANAFGEGKDASGVFFVLDYANRNFHVGTHGRATPIFSENKISNILIRVEDVLSQDLGNARRATNTFLTTTTNIFQEYRQSFGVKLFVFMIASFLVGGIVVIIMIMAHKRSLPGGVAGNHYVDQNNVRYRQPVDRFVNTYTSRTKRPEQNNNSGGGSSSSGGSSSGGGSTTHSSSSGSSFGGGSRSF